MDRKDFTRHISGALNQSLEEVFDHILKMGGMVEKQIDCAIEALQKSDKTLANEVLNLDKDVNKQEVEVDTLCARIVARQQPTALDLRLVLSAIRMAVDLERMGDEAVKIAKFVLKMVERDLSCNQLPGLSHLIEISLRSSKMLRAVLDDFARLNIEDAAKTIQEEEVLDEVYKNALQALEQDVMTVESEQKVCVLELIFALRAAERMSDHARNIAESIIYLVTGHDVRDMKEEEIFAFLKEFEAE